MNTQDNRIEAIRAIIPSFGEDAHAEGCRDLLEGLWRFLRAPRSVAAFCGSMAPDIEAGPTDMDRLGTLYRWAAMSARPRLMMMSERLQPTCDLPGSHPECGQRLAAIALADDETLSSTFNRTTDALVGFLGNAPGLLPARPLEGMPFRGSGIAETAVRLFAWDLLAGAGSDDPVAIDTAREALVKGIMAAAAAERTIGAAVEIAIASLGRSTGNDDEAEDRTNAETILRSLFETPATA